MSKVITFSRIYPGYHPRAGEPTGFVEKIVRSLHEQDVRPWDIDPSIFNEAMYWVCESKHNTIRAGHRWKAGDWFSPRVWSGRPYNSKMIQFAPDIQIKKVWNLDIDGTDWYLDGRHEYTTGWNVSIETIAKNDGLSRIDFYDWFMLSPDFKKKHVFNGQIICWNESIEY